MLVRKRSKALGLLGSDWKKRRVALYGRGNALAPRNVLLVLSEPASDEVTEELELDAASAGEARRSEVGGFVCVEVPNPRAGGAAAAATTTRARSSSGPSPSSRRTSTSGSRRSPTRSARAARATRRPRIRPRSSSG